MLLAFNLSEELRKQALGFSIQRVDRGTETAPASGALQDIRWLPNMLRFPSDTATGPNGSDRSPIQRFRWGDYTATPGHKYVYSVTVRGGTPEAMTNLRTLEIAVTTVDPKNQANYVYFNRAAAASQAYVAKFGNQNPDDMSAPQRAQALAWLSRGLKEALIGFMEFAFSSDYSLHGAVYEFQNEELLGYLKQASDRGVDVKIAYHARVKDGKATEGEDTASATSGKDHTCKDNVAAIKDVGITALCHPRAANPQSAIMHNKFLVLSKNGNPVAVWTGSTNWTDGGLYGQLNVGHAIFDADLAAKYESYFQILFADDAFADERDQLARLTKLPSLDEIKDGYTPIFSPQKATTGPKTPAMIDLYAKLIHASTTLVVCAPFELHDAIKAEIEKTVDGTLRYIMVDKPGSLGDGQEVELTRGSASNIVSVATVLKSPLHDFQNRLLMDKESFHHSGVHIHSKIIIQNPLSDDPVLVTGSANFSNNSSMNNDENSVIIRGQLNVVDIYLTEFMRMFDQYFFRAARASAQDAGGSLGLKSDSTWTDKYYHDVTMTLEREAFSKVGGAKEQPNNEFVAPEDIR